MTTPDEGDTGEKRPPDDVCWCCSVVVVERDPDPWDGRLDGYCDDCALSRCDALPGACERGYDVQMVCFVPYPTDNPLSLELGALATPESGTCDIDWHIHLHRITRKASASGRSNDRD